LHLVEVHQVVVLEHRITVTQMVHTVEAVEELEPLVRVPTVELVLVTGTQVLVVALSRLVEATHLLVVQEEQMQFWVKTTSGAVGVVVPTTLQLRITEVDVVVLVVVVQTTLITVEPMASTQQLIEAHTNLVTLVQTLALVVVEVRTTLHLLAVMVVQELS
jgi:hypothetical protein